MASRRYRSKDFSPWFNSQVPCLDFDAFFKMFSFVSCRHYKCQRTIFFLRILITINLLFFKDINRLSKKLFLNGRLKSRESHHTEFFQNIPPFLTISCGTICIVIHDVPIKPLTHRRQIKKKRDGGVSF